MQPLSISWTKNRIKRGFSPVILIVGKQRMGKTFTALTWAYAVDKNFNPEKQMFFDILSFAKAMQKYNNKVLILDEAGIELDTYRYSDMRQRAFSHIVQSQAYKQNTLLLVLPHASDMAKCHRKYVDALAVIYARGCAIVYKPVIRYWDMNDIDIKSRKMEIISEIPLPPSWLINEYKSRYEKQIKQGIMDSELDRLDKFINKIKPVKEEIPLLPTP